MNWILVDSMAYYAVCYRISPPETLVSKQILQSLEVNFLESKFPLLYPILCMKNHYDDTKELRIWLEGILF
jgi:hypothetical protein